MKRLSRISKGLFLFVIFISGLQAYGQIKFREITEEEEWLTAVEDSKASDKLIFLDIYATWCGPCKYLDKNVYTDSTLGEYYNSRFINLKMDGETTFGMQMARKYQLSAYPTMFYINSDEEIITRIVGVREPDPLQDIGKVISENHSEFEYLSLNYEKDSLSAEELSKYQSLLNQIEQNEKAVEVAKKIIPSLTDNEIISEKYKSLIVKSAPDIDSRIFKVVEENKEIIDTVWNSQEIDQFYAGVFNTTLFNAIDKKDEVLLNRIIDEFLPAYMGEESGDLEQGEFITRKLYYANTQDWERYNELVMGLYDKRFDGDDKFLYMEAYEVANEYSQSPGAVKMAVNWMEKATGINPSFDNLILISYLNIVDGNTARAGEYIERIKALEINEEQQQVLDEIEKLISQGMNG